MSRSRCGRDARRDEVVQQSLGRAADAGAHAGGHALWRVRDRHEPRGRDHAACEDGAAARRHRHDGRAGASRLLSRRSRRSPRRRPRSSSGSSPAASPVLNRDNPHFDLLAKRATAAGARVVSFGLAQACRCPSLARSSSPRTAPMSTARRFGREIAYRLGVPGAHIAQNSLAVVAALDVLQARISSWRSRRSRRLARRRRPGRTGSDQGRRRRAAAHRRELQRQPGVDARRARHLGGAAARALSAAHRGDRRHARARRRRPRRCTRVSRRRSTAPASIWSLPPGPIWRISTRASAGGQTGCVGRDARTGIREALLAAIKPGRRRDGQGIAREPHGAARRGDRRRNSRPKTGH